jgi:SAM-dependent methyltransferase
MDIIERSSIIKKIYKSSVWFKLTMLLLLSLITVTIIKIGRRGVGNTEGFSQNERVVIKYDDDIYDSVYSELYKGLKIDENRIEYEIGSIINDTDATGKSFILDVGSGVGEHVALFNSKGIHATGVDKSKAMINKSKNIYPDYEFKNADVNGFGLYKPYTFTHITVLHNTVYEIEDKLRFFRNCFEWLMPGGYLMVHLVNRETFNPNKNKSTQSNISYKSKFNLSNDSGLLEETLKDGTHKTIKNIFKLHMETRKNIINKAKKVGFIQDKIISLDPVYYNDEYIYVLYKPS